MRCTRRQRIVVIWQIDAVAPTIFKTWGEVKKKLTSTSDEELMLLMVSGAFIAVSIRILDTWIPNYLKWDLNNKLLLNKLLLDVWNLNGLWLCHSPTLLILLGLTISCTLWSDYWTFRSHLIIQNLNASTTQHLNLLCIQALLYYSQFFKWTSK